MASTVLGIYRITNILNNKFYYGSAISLKRRFGEHRKDLKLGCHSNPYFQNDFNKYGKKISNFIFEVVENVQREEELLAVEQKYLDKYYDNQNMCYNICPTAGSHLGMKRTEETKKKMSLAALGKKKSKIHVKRMTKTKRKKYGKIIHQFDMNGNFIKTWHGIRNAARETGTFNICISPAINGKAYMAGGYLWGRNKNDGETLKNKYLSWKQKESERKSLQFKKEDKIIPIKKIRQKHTEETKMKISNAKNNIKIPVLQFDKEGNFINFFPSIIEAKKNTRVHHINECIKNNKSRKTAGGFIWKSILNRESIMGNK